MRVLDCTLRDGGYYNRWDFDHDLVDKYLESMNEAGVDVVELGFRYAPKSGFLGPYAYLSEELINKFDCSRYSFDLAVMIEEPDITSFGSSGRDFIDEFFVSKDESQVSVVRIAVHFERAELVVPAVRRLHELGYEVIVNLMQISRICVDDVGALLRELSKVSEISALYFADSLGSMSVLDVEQLCDVFKSSWGRLFGFHAHNNCGQAVENSMVAIAHGCGLIDCTVTGMGRGAGNALTETVLLRSGRCELDDMPALIDLVLDHFTPLRAKYGWGESLTYQIAAKGQVHPTYVQTLETQRSDLKRSEIAAVVKRLSKMQSSSFSDAILTQAILNEQQGVAGNIDEMPDFSGKPIVLLGPGASLKKHRLALDRYVEKSNSILVSCSVSLDPTDWPFNYFICSSARARDFVEDVSATNCERIFVTPYPVAEEVASKVGNCRQYPLSFSDDQLDISPEKCSLGTYKSLIYAVSYCYAAGGQKIFLAGFDGYGEGDPRSIEMSYWLSRLTSELNVELTSLLPTIYPINQSSVYSFYV